MPTVAEIRKKAAETAISKATAKAAGETDPKKKKSDDDDDEESKPKLGSGERFEKLKGTLKKKGAKSPSGLAAYIGRKKYGAKKMAKMATAGRKKG